MRNSSPEIPAFPPLPPDAPVLPGLPPTEEQSYALWEEHSEPPLLGS